MKSSAPKSGGSTAKTIKASKPVKVTAASAKPTKATGAKPTKTKAATTHGGSKKTTTTTTAGSTSPHGPSSTTTPSPAPGTWTPSNPVAQKLSTKANLLSKVTNSLPPHTDLNAATAGFKNFGQFVAAVNVSNNLGIAFGDLKAAVTGTTLAGTATGQPTLSLGQTIQQLKPGVNANTEAQKAQTLAEQETIVSPTTTTRTSARNAGKNGHPW